MVAQDRRINETVILIETKYTTKYYPTEFPVSYCAIKKSILDSVLFRIGNDTTFCDETCITYFVTQYGGVYLKDARRDIYTQACCRSGDIPKTMMSQDSIEVFNEAGKIEGGYKYFFPSPILKAKLAHKLKFKDEYGKYRGDYTIRFWIADVTYCKCDLYMDRAGQGIFGKKIGYLWDLQNIRKVEKATAKKVDACFNNYFQKNVKR